MDKRLRVTLVAVTTGVIVAIAAGLATACDSASRQATRLTPGSYKINTKLTTGLAVPHPKGTMKGTGKLTGVLKVTSATKASLTWKLTYAHLTGAALSAQIHLGEAGKTGKKLLSLCAPCRSGRHGTTSVAAAAATALAANKTYVNVSTKANPKGEIRGNVKTTATGGGTTSANPYANMTVAVTPALVAQGKALSDKFGCEACHTLTGAKSTGPTWKGLAGRKVHLTDGQVVTATDGYLINAIEQPDAEIVQGYSSGIMTTAIGNIPVAQAKAIVAYIKSLK
jgi:cytochrome c1